MEYEGIVEVVSLHLLVEQDEPVNVLLRQGGWVLLKTEVLWDVRRDSKPGRNPSVVYVLGRKQEESEEGK